MKTTRWGLPLLLAVLLLGCRDFDELQLAPFEPEIAIPLIDSRIVINDLIEQLDTIGFIKVDPDGLIRLEFTGDTITETAAEIFEDLNNFPSTPIPLLINPFTINLDALDGVSVDTAFLKSGQLAITELTNPTNQNLDFELSLPEFFQGGQAFSFSTTLGPGESFTNTDQPFDLTGYEIIPQGGEVSIRYTATDENSNDVSLAGNLTVQFSDLQFGLVYGTFETIDFEGVVDTIDVDFFSTYQEGQFAFDDPRALINVESTIGIPSRVTLTSFDIVPAPTPGNPNPAPVPLDPPNLAFDLNFPTRPGESAFTEIVIDKTNSNADEVFSQIPTRIDYQLDGQINPDNEQFTGYSTDTGFVRGIILLDLPLVGSITDYLVRDTFDLDLEDLDSFKEGAVRLRIENEIPLGMSLTIFFEDDFGNRLLQLLPDAPVVAEPAEVDNAGNPVAPALASTDIPISEEEFETLLESARAILEVRFGTSNFPQDVRISENENATIQLGLRAKLADEDE